MKRTFESAIVIAVAASAFLISSCGTTKVGDPRGKVLEAPASETDKVVVVDWADRVMGEVAAPTWLKNMRRGNSDAFKELWNIRADRVVKLSMAAGKTEAAAQALSRSGFAYTQAAELNQKIIGRVGQGLNSAGQLEALFTAASETKAEMTGLREEAGFWQKVRTKNAETKQVTEQFIYYTVYSMDKSTWDMLCEKYLMAMMSGANLETETKKKIGALFSEMKADADKKDAAKQAAEEAENLSSYLM